ncbi:MAG: hypothetical protein CM15mP123_06430 [Gammaproteobacteria bacterium]|nr:MAG: hypothetical protein CM15mP123_06430 [Gammaproteobacteria bacterium]
MVEEGKVNLDDPVAKYWPEFAQEGKEKIPVRYLFCHKSGLCGVTTPLPDDAYYNWDVMVNALAAQNLSGSLELGMVTMPSPTASSR